VIDPHVVKLATEYLDQRNSENHQATLVGMHWYIDGRNKTLPTLEEVNEALSKRANVRVQRLHGAVVFGLGGTKRAVTIEDMRKADKSYRKEFAAALKKLNK
jgi:exopolysaccharide biosynthesis predicted pyruvyltransferase EpsI